MSLNGDAARCIEKFLSESFEGRVLDPEDDIFALGFVNSLFAMQLVDFVEAQFAITVESADLEMENFRSIAALAAFVEHKLGATNMRVDAG